MEKNLPAKQETQETRFNPWVSETPCRRKRQPTPGLLPGKPHGQRSLAGYSPHGCRVRHDLAAAHTRKLTFVRRRKKRKYTIRVEE